MDAKFDYVVGFWVETSWVNKGKDMGMYTNQELINMGVDYTFGLGNGLNLIFEQFLSASDEEAFKFAQSTSFSLLNMNYNVGLFDNINAIIYYDWINNKIYNFITWQKQFNKWSFYLMGYANPKEYIKEELFAKSGQLLKRSTLSEVQKIQGRWFPTKIIFKDMLKEGNGTEFKITSVKFNQEIPEYIFTKAALKQ